MEENQETFDGLSKIIEDWNISFRIIEKIAIWDIRYSTEKVTLKTFRSKSYPTLFFTKPFCTTYLETNPSW